MTLDDPSALQEGVSPLVVPQVDTLSRVKDDITGARTSRWTIPHEFLEVSDVVRRYCNDISIKGS